MTEQELLDAIRESAGDLEIPEELTPARVQERLKRRERHVRLPRRQLAQAAAVLVLAVGMTAVASLGLGQIGDPGRNPAGNETERADASKEQKRGTDDKNTAMGTAAAKRDAGDMFLVARSENQVYEMLERSWKEYDMGMDEGENLAGSEKDNVWGSLFGEDAESNGQSQIVVNDSEKHSQTNVQTAGVDESDIIKTDGNYIYAVCENTVVITDISGDGMQVVARIQPQDDDARVREMYVSGDKLNLILEWEEAVLERAKSGTASEELLVEQSRRNQEAGAADAFYMNDHSVTCLETYDIGDRKSPVLEKTVSQDGAYYTSRKIGDIVYLFTREYRMNEIPSINNRKVTYDCIYLPEHGTQGLVVSSIDIKQPDWVQDNVVIFNDYVSTYVSTDAMYLYQSTWEGQGTVTQIAKFSLDKGEINAVGTATVKGEIRDTFAINQGSGQLRVLTTDWTEGENVNQLYLFDEEMKLTGSLQGLARGEQVYAARFLNNMAYFVTYRNTDPLFVVDLSDAANPRVLSELKITGFSEYLHFWGADKLLGIGYETDPDTGRTLGVKLSMFDISDPSQVTVRDSLVLEELNESPALYEYKAVLADSEENLFGFVGSDWQASDGGEDVFYYLYQWGEAGFERLLKEKVDCTRGLNQYRGLYSGGRFYIADSAGVTSYDRGDAYQKIGEVKY